MSEKTKINTAWLTALTQLDNVSKLMMLSEGVHQQLRNFERILTVSIPVRMDNGSLRIFNGFRVQHNSARGPYKGGVIVSYFEWVQDVQCYFWCEHEVNARLKNLLDRSYEEVIRLSQERKVNLRTAAMILAVKKVADATMVRGLYP